MLVMSAHLDCISKDKEKKAEEMSVHVSVLESQMSLIEREDNDTGKNNSNHPSKAFNFLLYKP
jgi:hypothetical protein